MMQALAKRSGQALVEAMVALTILIVAFMGILVLLNTAIRLNATIVNNYIGAYLAEEGVEVIKNVVDSNVEQGNAWGTNLANGTYEVQYNDTPPLKASLNRFLNYDTTNFVYIYTGPNPTPFKRIVTLNNLSANELQVDSVVTWTTGPASFQVDAEDIFLNWR